MKILKGLSVLGIVAISSACGSSNNTALVPTAGQVQTSTSTTGTAISGTTVALQGGAGTMTVAPIAALVSYSPTAYTVSATVNAGDRINFNPAASSYNIYQATCSSGITANLNSSYSTQPQVPFTVTFNGQPITSGTIAPVTGTVTVSATLASSGHGASCVFGSLNVYSYAVYMYSPYLIDPYTGQASLAVQVEHCVSPAGATISCPY